MTEFMNAAMILTQGNRFLRDFCNLFICYARCADVFEFKSFVYRTDLPWIGLMQQYQLVRFSYNRFLRIMSVDTEREYLDGRRGNIIEAAYENDKGGALFFCNKKLCTFRQVVELNGWCIYSLPDYSHLNYLVTLDGKNVVCIRTENEQARFPKLRIEMAQVDSKAYAAHWSRIIDTEIKKMLGSVQIDDDRFFAWGLDAVDPITFYGFAYQLQFYRATVFNKKTLSAESCPLAEGMMRHYAISHAKNTGKGRVVFMFHNPMKKSARTCGAVADFNSNKFRTFILHDTIMIDRISLVYDRSADALIFFGGSWDEKLKWMQSPMCFHVDVATLAVTRLPDLPMTFGFQGFAFAQ